MAKQQARGDVGAVGQPERDDPRRVAAVALGRGDGEARELVGPRQQVGDVELPDREAAEEARHRPLEHLAARRQQRRAGRQLTAQRDEVVLVAAGAVQQQQRQRPRARLEDVLEAEVVLGRGHRQLSCLTAEMSSVSVTRSETSMLPLPSAWLNFMP